MKGKVKKIDDKLQLILTPENRQEKAWLVNAFYCISPGVLSSNDGDVQSLVLWTDDNRKLPRKHTLRNNPVEEHKEEKP